MEESVANFQLNSSLVPGTVFNCHLELVLTQADSGFFVYFDSMVLAEAEQGGDCEEDYVQFGRDILFITSHRSAKHCGRVEGSPIVSPPAANSTQDPDTSTARTTPLDKRIYSEHADTEMDIWIKVVVPRHEDRADSSVRPKTLSLVVTPYKVSCSSQDRRHRRCGRSKHCIRSELFCDGTVNCAVASSVPADEHGCKVTTVPPVTETALWERTSLHHAIGTCASLLVCGLLLFYLGRTCWCRPAPAAPLPKESGSLGPESRGSVVEQQDLIHMADGLIVPVSRPRMAGSRLAPPSYSDSVMSHSEQREWQQSFSSTRGFTPQYSYTNR